jgi:hypothetical protein
MSHLESNFETLKIEFDSAVEQIRELDEMNSQKA